jgi:ATP-binding cassette subfamily B protein
MSDLRRVLGYAKPYKKDIIAAIVLLGLVVAADLSIPRLVQVLIDDGVANQDMAKVFTTSILMIGASLLSALFMVGNTIASVRAGKNYEADLRNAVFKKVQTFSYGNMDDFNVGQLLTRMTSDINQLQMMIIMGLRMFTRAPLMFVGSITIMYTTNPQLANVMIALLPLTLILVTVFVRTMQPFFTKVQERLENLNQVMQENLSGIRVVKAFVRREYENERFGDANTQLFETQLKFTQLMSIFFPIIMALMNLGTVAIIYFGGLQVFAGVMGGQISAASASAKRIMEVLDAVPEVQEAEKPVELVEIEGRVVFDDVTFSYRDDGGDPVLTNISFIAEPGENVAILGSTGSGKSSLVNLIPRFYDANKGKVTIDGEDVKDISTQSLMSRIGVSLQDVVLFSGTIRDNIKYGRPDATEEEVLTASKAAQAHEFITGFPEGYETMVGQRGVNLSGGQKQRVAIARALLVKPKILILDDSTSAVDVETETKIEEALEELMADTTSFTIAQRISTVLNADKILVLDEGKIVAEGNHAQLMDTSPIYQEIYDSQLGEGGATQ